MVTDANLGPNWKDAVRNYDMLCSLWDAVHNYMICAAWWYDKSIDDVTAQDRAQMKVMLFGHVYGGSIKVKHTLH